MNFAVFKSQNTVNKILFLLTNILVQSFLNSWSHCIGQGKSKTRIYKYNHYIGVCKHFFNQEL